MIKGKSFNNFPNYNDSFNTGLNFAEQLYIDNMLATTSKHTLTGIDAILSGTISKERQDIIKEIGVIDSHSHIGNNLVRKPDQVFDETKNFPIDIRTIGANFGKFRTPGKLFSAIMKTNFFENLIRESGKDRNNSATLKNFGESLDISFISKAICLPIPPHQTFDDLKSIEKYDDRIISFTGVDFKKYLINGIVGNPIFNLEGVEEQFINDIENGARGIKIHPIIQGISPDSDMVNEVVRLWTEVSKGLPIIFHTGVTEYCTKNENCNIHKPKYGDIKYFKNLAKNHRDANVIIGHAGLFQVDDVIDELSQYSNISVDTSFQGKEKIFDLLNNFGVERLLFASDWPYGDRIPAINVMLDTLSNVVSCLHSKERVRELIFRDNALNSMKMK